MSRSIWKGNYISKSLLRESAQDKPIIKVWDRASCIPYNLRDQAVLIYTGKEFKKIFITRDKIGYKFGELCFTRKPRKKTENDAIKKRRK